MPVDLTPKGDFPPADLPKPIETHAKHLTVKGMNTNLDQVGDDVKYVAVGVHKNVFPILLSNAAIIPVHRFEMFAENRRINHHRMLGAPIIHQKNRIHLRFGPGLYLPAKMPMKAVDQIEKTRLLHDHIHQGDLHGTEKLESFKGADNTSGIDELIRGAAETVDRFHIQVERGLRKFQQVEILPGANHRFMHNPHHTLLPVDKPTTPFIDKFAGPVFSSHQRQRFPEKRRCLNNIIRKTGANPTNPFRIPHFSPGKHPKMTRNPVGCIKIQCLYNQFSGC